MHIHPLRGINVRKIKYAIKRKARRYSCGIVSVYINFTSVAMSATWMRGSAAN